MWNAIVSSRIWTRVAVSISYNDNHYTTGTFSNLSFIYPIGAKTPRNPPKNIFARKLRVQLITVDVEDD